MGRSSVRKRKNWLSLLLGDLNKADNGMSSHKTLVVSILGISPCVDQLKAFIGGFGRVQAVIYTVIKTSAGIDSDALL